MTLFLIALAGGLGGTCRFLVDALVAKHNRHSVPMGTVVVNATACFLLGLVAGALATHAQWHPLQEVLGVGFLGGYSTFSTASLESARLVRQKRYGAAALLSGGMIVVSLATVLAGLLVSTFLV